MMEMMGNFAVVCGIGNLVYAKGMRIQNILLAVCGGVIASSMLSCKQAEKQVAEPARPAPSTERVINPWSTSSDPGAHYQSMGDPTGVINPWGSKTSPSTEGYSAPAELPLPDIFSGVPRAAALSTLRNAAPAPEQ